MLAQSLLAAYLTLTASASLADLVGQKVAAALGLIAAAAQTGMATYLALIDRRDGGAGWASESDDWDDPLDGPTPTLGQAETALGRFAAGAAPTTGDDWLSATRTAARRAREQAIYEQLRAP